MTNNQGDITIIDNGIEIGKIYGDVLVKFSDMIRLSLENKNNFNKEQIRCEDTVSFSFNKCIGEPYFYQKQKKVNWDYILSIINSQNKIIEKYNSNSRVDTYKDNLNEVKIAAIIADFYQMTKLHNILLLSIQKYYNETPLDKITYITKEICKFVVSNNPVISAILEDDGKPIDQDIQKIFERGFVALDTENILNPIIINNYCNDNFEIYRTTAKIEVTYPCRQDRFWMYNVKEGDIHEYQFIGNIEFGENKEYKRLFNKVNYCIKSYVDSSLCITNYHLIKDFPYIEIHLNKILEQYNLDPDEILEPFLASLIMDKRKNELKCGEYYTSIYFIFLKQKLQDYKYLHNKNKDEDYSDENS